MVEKLSGYHRWTALVQRFRWLVVACWLTTSIFGFMYGLKFLTNTKSNYQAPDDSPSVIAGKVMKSYFPEFNLAEMEGLFVQAIRPGLDLTADPLATNISDFATLATTKIMAKYPKNVQLVTSYYFMANLLGLPLLAAEYISDDKSATMIMVSYTQFVSDKERIEFVDYLSHETQVWLKTLNLEDDISVGVFGSSTIDRDVSKSSEEDIARIHTYVLPLAFVLLTIAVGSLPLIIIPILAIPASILLQFLVMYPISTKLEIISFAPALMLSISLGMGIDYSLFLLTRLMDFLRKDKPLEASVFLMMRSAGHVIIVSGLTLSACVLGQAFLPMPCLQSFALCGCIALFILILCSFTLIPALLFIMGPNLVRADKAMDIKGKIERLTSCFSSKSVETSEHVKKSPKKSAPTVPSPGKAVVVVTKEITTPRTPKTPKTITDLTDDDDDYLEKGFWFYLAKFLVNPWKGGLLLVLVLGLAVPVIVSSFQLQVSLSIKQLLPAGSPSEVLFYDLLERFKGPGIAFPYQVAFRAQPGRYPDGVKTEEAFNNMQIMTQKLVEMGGSKIENYQSTIVIAGQWVPYKDFKEGMEATGFLAPAFARTMQMLSTVVYANDNQGMLVRLKPLENVLEPSGKEWLWNARDLMAKEGAIYGFDVYFFGVSAGFHDAVDRVFQAFPKVAAGMAALLFVIIAIVFRSVTAALRSVLSILFTVAVVYGSGVLVYQKGMLGFIPFQAFEPRESIFWFVVLNSLAVIVGLSLDYDVFLITRVLEYRLKGYSNKASLIRAMVNTGQVITFAGTIMAVAFSGLMFSTSHILNEISLLLTVSVLLDTFIVRTIIVPVVINLSGNYVWWPRKLPPVTRVCELCNE